MKRLIPIALLLASASVAPMIFPVAQAGWSSLDVLAKAALLPSIAVMGLSIAVLLGSGERRLGRIAIAGLAAGALATTALEAIRLPGFLLGFMPETFHGLWASCSSISSLPVRRCSPTWGDGCTTSGMAPASGCYTFCCWAHEESGQQFYLAYFSGLDSSSVRLSPRWAQASSG